MSSGTRRPGTLLGETYIRSVPSPFNDEQILRYCTKIGLDEVQDATSLQSFESNLSNLGRLQFLHNLAFPQDVSSLHYTKEHHMPVTPQELYQSMVLGGKGSYCFGQNGLFLGMLRGLGYRAYGAAGRVLVPSRVSPKALEYSGLNHYVVLVQPLPAPHANVTFVVDVGFGGTGLLRPLLLADGSADTPQTLDDNLKGGWVWGSYPPERHRVVSGSFPDGSIETALGSGEAPRREWHFQVSHESRLRLYPEEDTQWHTLFTFMEDEFFLNDIEEASFCVSNMPRFIFNNTVICTKRLVTPLERSEDEEEIALWGGVQDQGVKWLKKWNLQGDKVTLRAGARVIEERIVSTERERLEALRDVFGVNVTLEDEQWIKGRLAALSSA